jgi:uncharacterized membrane protein
MLPNNLSLAEEGILPDDLIKLLNTLPQPHQNTVKEILTGMAFLSLWEGPLPSPDALKAYNEAMPNGADRLLTEVQRQARHRMELERLVIPEQQRQSRRGQLYGLIVALSFLIASFVLIQQGHGLFGTIIGSIDMVALVTVFVVGRQHPVHLHQNKPHENNHKPQA